MPDHDTVVVPRDVLSQLLGCADGQTSTEECDKAREIADGILAGHREYAMNRFEVVYGDGGPRLVDMEASRPSGTRRPHVVATGYAEEIERLAEVLNGSRDARTAWQLSLDAKREQEELF